MKRLTLLVILFLISFSISAQVPYSESFETGFGIWNQISSPEDQFDWTRSTGPTPSPVIGTGPAVASDGSYFAYIEATGHNNPPESAILEASFDFSGTTMPILSFDYHMWGQGIGFFHVFVFDGTTWTEEWNQFNNQGNVWNNVKLCLDDYAGNPNVKIRFKAETQYSDSSDIAIDNIEIADFSFSNITKTDLTCGGYSNGKINITLLGGFSPYEYSINEGVDYTADPTTNHVFTGLTGGDYVVRAKDESGCVIKGGTVHVFEPETPDITTNKTDVYPCSYSHNGEIEITATGPNSPFTYSIYGSGGPFQTSNSFTGLNTGNYQIAVKSTNGCIALGSNVAINCPTEIHILDVQTEDVSTCNGDCNGDLKIMAGGGNSPIEFSIDEGINFSTSNYFSDLCADNYRIIIRDAKNCKDTTTYYPINQPNALTFVDVAKTDVQNCFGNDDGTIDVEATGGTGTIEYSIDNGYLYQTSSHFDNLPAGEYHLVIRDSKNCSADWGIININQPDLLLIDSVVVDDVSGCNGNANGEIHIFAQGGTGALQYSIDNGTTLSGSKDFTGLDVGNYHPYVIDANNCERVAPEVSITEPSQLIISDVLTFDVSDCYGASSGKIQILASLGQPPYRYSIDGGTTYQTSYVFENLPAGEYYSAILDNNDCEVIGDTVVIAQPTEISIEDQLVTDVSCYGAADGSIYVYATEGIGDLRYSIDNGLTFPFNNGTFAYQQAGTYNIAVRDDNDCVVYGDELIIHQPDSLSIDSVTVVDVANCYGDSTGIITLHVSGGTAPLNYSINNGSTTQLSDVFTDLPARTGYLPFVTDYNGCFAMANPETIGQPSQFYVIDQTHTDVDTCHGVAAGTLNIVAAGGIGAISYSIDNGNTFFENGGVFTDLYAGTYDIVIKDSKNCTDVGWQEIINEPDTLIIDSVYYQDVVCNGQGNGEIIIYAQGGQPQRMYSVNGGYTFSSSWQFINQQPGTYDILVKDNFNCQVTDMVTLTQPEGFFLDSVTYTDVGTCYGDSTGTITVFAHGGVPDIEYSYTDLSLGSSDFQASNFFENISAGSYYVTAKDENGCTLTSEAFNVVQPSQVQFSDYESTDISCNGLNDGIINVSATGGAGNYEYSIDYGNNWSGVGVFTDLVEGIYSIMARDTNGCSAIYPVSLTVNNPAQLQIYDLVVYNPHCFGYSDGKIVVYPTGGTGEFSFILNDTLSQDESTFDSLPADSYWITVSDENNCIAQSDTVDVVMPQNFAQFNYSIKEGCSPLEVDFTALSSNSVYEWIFGDGDTTMHVNPTHLFINHTGESATYTQTVVASHGVCSDTLQDSIIVYSQPSLDFSIDTAIHYYPDTNVYINNYTTEYENYLWNFGDGQTQAIVSPSVHSYTTCGEYSIVLTAENGLNCTDTSIVDVMVTAVEPEASFLIDNISGCAPLEVNFTNLSANAQDYQWLYDGEIFSIDENPNYIFENDGELAVVLNALGYCDKVSTMTKLVSVFPIPDIDFRVDPDTVAVGQDVAFTNYTSGASYYIWEFGDGESSGEDSPRRPYETAGLYDVTLKAYSANGCRDSLTLSQEVYVISDLFINFPTAFSPDGDGINDFLSPFYNMVSNCKIEIYNRLGQPVFITEDFKNMAWDGTKNGKPLPYDTYVWRAVGQYASGQYFEEVGEVTLVR